jgi:hypothetical protein
MDEIGKITAQESEYTSKCIIGIKWQSFCQVTDGLSEFTTTRIEVLHIHIRNFRLWALAWLQRPDYYPLTLSDPMSDLVRHYDFSVPGAFLDL